MVTIEQVTHPTGDIALGALYEFTLRGVPESTLVRFFVKSNGILYPQPLSNWSLWTKDKTLSLLPESPGEYYLIVHWKQSEGHVQVCEKPFTVAASIAPKYIPTKVAFDDKTQVWAPSDWEAAMLSNHEKSVLKLLPSLVKSGDIVYDVGANIGLFSICFAKLIGPNGKLYCIEANPVCVYFLRSNMELNHLTNFDILPIALLDAAKVCDFAVNYDNFNLGLTKDSVFFEMKAGHRITVEAQSLDELIGTYGFQKPDLVKIDIEGAEAIAIKGMTNTIVEHRPTMVIELHGKSAAHATLIALDQCYYRYQECSTQKFFRSAKELVDWMTETCIQVIALPN
jgi:FkbM family methyltransferase